MKAVLVSALVALATLSTFSWQASAEADIRLIDPWVRALPPGAKVTGAYMILQNDGSTEDALVSVTSPSAEVVEIHQTKEEDGMMRMEKVEKIALAPGQKVELKPGGYHLMLINVKDTDEIKRKWITLTLKFAKSGEMEFRAPLRAITAQATK